MSFALLSPGRFHSMGPCLRSYNHKENSHCMTCPAEVVSMLLCNAHAVYRISCACVRAHPHTCSRVRTGRGHMRCRFRLAGGGLTVPADHPRARCLFLKAPGPGGLMLCHLLAEEHGRSVARFPPLLPRPRSNYHLGSCLELVISPCAGPRPPALPLGALPNVCDGPRHLGISRSFSIVQKQVPAADDRTRPNKRPGLLGALWVSWY